MTLFRDSLDDNQNRESDLNKLFNWINGWSDPIAFTIAVAGTEVSVPHDMELIPAGAVPVVTEQPTGTGVVYPGTTAWTSTNVYLTATVAGDYVVVLRRE